jgi:capsular polysaccharide biosynthesis protein
MDNGHELIRQPYRGDGPPLPPVAQLETALVPRVSVSAAFRRHWVTVLTPVAVLMVLAVILAANRVPTYTAETTLAVGDVSETSAAALAGFTSASRSIADTYSRSIDSEDIIDPAARRLGADPDLIKAQISATPVPESSVMAIRAESGSGQTAVAVANEVANSLVRYSRSVAESEEATESLLDRYEQAEVQAQNARAEAQAAFETFGAIETPEAQEELSNARAAEQAAELRAEGLRAAYQSTQEAGGSAALAEVINPARGADSDRTSYLGFLLVIAVVAGLAIGLALALIRANLQARRLLA